MNQTSGSGSGRQAAAFVRRLFGWTLVVALTGAVFWLLSERNARTFLLEERGGELIVMRGRMFPFGFERYQPSEKARAQTYAPLAIAGAIPPGIVGKRFADREELDRALFEVLKKWIDACLSADSPAKLADGMSLLARAESLHGIEIEQRLELREMQVRIAFFEGRSRLEQATGAMREALAKLRLASEGRGRYAREAGEMALRVSPMLDTLARLVETPARESVPAAPAEPKADEPASGQPAVLAPGEAAEAKPASLPGGALEAALPKPAAAAKAEEALPAEAPGDSAPGPAKPPEAPTPQQRP